MPLHLSHIKSSPSADTAVSNIYTDNLGRIKVQFPWDRYGEKNQNSSCWIRVSAAWAGNQLGAMHLPRIGEEVLVDFLGGDPDLPIVKGRIFNALNMPPWSLPEQQALSGFRSRELIPGVGNSAAGRSNHFVQDDTEQKIQAQLKSDHQHSSLSLGHITRIEDNAGRKDARGEGFELRTDGHGVLRAKDGLLITTEARPNAQAHAKDMGETTARLAQAQDQHASLGDLAAQHLAQDAADQGDVAQDIQAQNTALKGGTPEPGRFLEFAEPHITFASPADIASTTPGTTHQHSGRHHAITSGAHTSISSNKSLRATGRPWPMVFQCANPLRDSAMWIFIKAMRANCQCLINAFFVSALLHASTYAQNYIFLSGQPLVAVSGKGEFERFSLGEYDSEQSRYVSDAQMVEAVRSLWFYETGSTTEKVAAKIEEDYVGCDRSLVLKVEDHYQSDLLSTKPLPQRKATPAGWGDGDYKSTGRSLLSGLLRKERVSGRWIKRLLAKAKVTEVYMASGKSSALVITTNESHGDKSFAAQIIANRNAAGKYAMSEKYVNRGGREDQDSFSGTQQLIMHLDLDGDGNEELLFERMQYESFGTSLLQWDGREWRDVGGNGGGC
jgi:hypothetical protein